MKSPTLHRPVSVLVALICLLGLQTALFAEDQPNIVYIVADNIGFEHMGKAYGGPTSTPTMDSIAEEGALMQRMYVPNPLCVPSRYSILAGRYPERCSAEEYLKKYPAGEEAWDSGVELEPDLANLPKTLQSAGYTTGFVGKFHNAHGKDGLISRKKWDGTHITDPEVTPILEKLNDRLNQHIQSCGFDWVGGAAFGNGLVSAASGIDTDGVHHNLEWEVDNALTFLDQQKDKDEPFFLYLATKLFHLPVNTEEDFLSDYDKVGRYTERGALKEAPNVPMPPRKEIVDIARREVGEAAIEDKGLDRNAIALRVLDFGIKAVLDRLEAMGVEENTIVIFVSDNAQIGKSTVYEGGIHVPSAIRWPRVIPSGTKVPEIVSTVDIAATLIDIAGTTPPEAMKADGTSFLPILKGDENAEWDNVTFAEYNCAKAVVTPRWKYIAVRYPKKQWKKIVAEDARNPTAPDFGGNPNRKKKWEKFTKPDLVESQLPMAMNIHRYWSPHDMNHVKRAGTFPFMFDLDQLYDLENDPREQRNLAGDPEYAEKLAEMKELMKREVSKLDRPFGEFSEIPGYLPK